MKAARAKALYTNLGSVAPKSPIPDGTETGDSEPDDEDDPSDQSPSAVAKRAAKAKKKAADNTSFYPAQDSTPISSSN